MVVRHMKFQSNCAIARKLSLDGRCVNPEQIIFNLSRASWAVEVAELIASLLQMPLSCPSMIA